MLRQRRTSGRCGGHIALPGLAPQPFPGRSHELFDRRGAGGGELPHSLMAEIQILVRHDVAEWSEPVEPTRETAEVRHRFQITQDLPVRAWHRATAGSQNDLPDINGGGDEGLHPAVEASADVAVLSIPFQGDALETGSILHLFVNELQYPLQSAPVGSCPGPKASRFAPRFRETPSPFGGSVRPRP